MLRSQLAPSLEKAAMMAPAILSDSFAFAR